MGIGLLTSSRAPLRQNRKQEGCTGKKDSVWSSLFKKLIILMISQADLEDLWIRLRGREALQWQMAACLFAARQSFKLFTVESAKGWFDMSRNSCFNEVYVNPVFTCDAGTEARAGFGLRLDFLLSSSLVSELCFCATSTPCLSSGPPQQHRRNDK